MLNRNKKMKNKLSLFILGLLLSFQLVGQNDNQIKRCENKICIDTLKTKLLISTWYDFSPDFSVEQSNWIIYYLNKPSDLKDGTNHKGTMTFKADGTFERSYKTNENTFLSYTGKWIILPETRQLKLTTSENGISQTWTVLELNKDTFIMKFGK